MSAKICSATGKELPPDLGGYQQVELMESRIEPGDLLVDREGMAFANRFEGCPVAIACVLGWRVYRKMPVPLQGGQSPVAGPHHSTVGLPHLDAAKRKALPITTGVLDYFPDAILAVAACSKAGNDQHNPGKPLHWDRSKSGDEADALGRHLLDRGKIDADGIRHSAKVAWRALAMLQKEIEASA